MGIDAALSLLIALLNNAATISALIAKAKAEGRENLSDDEWVSIISADDKARLDLVNTIAQAKSH